MWVVCSFLQIEVLMLVIETFIIDMEIHKGGLD